MIHPDILYSLGGKKTKTLATIPLLPYRAIVTSDILQKTPQEMLTWNIYKYFTIFVLQIIL